MTVAAGWHTDPSNNHQLRYWDGASWTDHVSDSGATATDPLGFDAPPPAPAAPPPPPAAPSAAAPAASGGGWMGKMKAAAAQAADQGKKAVDSAKTAATEKSAGRRAQYENDPNTLWMGESRTTASKAGMASAFYRLTKDRIWIESGVFGSKSEVVPLWSVKDVDVRQNMFQTKSDVGDVVLILEDASLTTSNAGFLNTGNFTGKPAGGALTGQVVLDNIEHPYQVRDTLLPLISDARHVKLMERQSQYIHYATPPPAAAPAPAAAPTEPAPDLGDQLRKLAALRDDGILTDEEFAAQKAKLLGS